MSSGDRKNSLLHRVDFLDDDDLGERNEEVIIENNTNSLFEQAIGHIEDIFMEEEFQALQDDFLRKNCDQFEDKEENKLEYSILHNEYTQLLETYIESELQKRIPNFTMEDLVRELIEKKEQLDGEVFEMLFTFTDFLMFKEMMLDFKKAKNGEVVDLSLGMTVTPMTPRMSSDVEMRSQSSDFEQFPQ